MQDYLWQLYSIQLDDTPMPPEMPDEDQDEAQFSDDPWITPYVLCGA